MPGPRVTLEQWHCLQTVIDQGGFAQAALVLHRSQSSVSYAVARLQEQLGTPLLRIEGRKAVLTQAGAVLLRRSRQLTQQAQALEQLAQQLAQGWEAEVRLVVDAAYPNQWLLGALQAFMPQSRGCRVGVHEAVLSGVEELLISGNTDVAIAALDIPGYLSDSLPAVDFIALAHPKHELHQLGRILTAEDLAQQLQIVIRDSGQQQPRDHGWLGAEQRWTVSSLSTALEVLRSGLGFAWLPEQMVKNSLLKEDLKALPLAQGAVRSISFKLYQARNKALGPATKILIECLKTYAQNPQLSNANPT